MGRLFRIFVTVILLAIAALSPAYAANVPADGTYQAAVSLEGGTGRASVASPAELTVESGKMTATVVWSSPYYDYMIVDCEKYLPESTENGAVFKIPVAALDEKLPVVADTTAMSVPHEIEYTLYFDSSAIAGGNSASATAGKDNAAADDQNNQSDNVQQDAGNTSAAGDTSVYVFAIIAVAAAIFVIVITRKRGSKRG